MNTHEAFVVTVGILLDAYTDIFEIMQHCENYDSALQTKKVKKGQNQHDMQYEITVEFIKNIRDILNQFNGLIDYCNKELRIVSATYNKTVSQITYFKNSNKYMIINGKFTMSSVESENENVIIDNSYLKNIWFKYSSIVTSPILMLINFLLLPVYPVLVSYVRPLNINDPLYIILHHLHHKYLSSLYCHGSIL